MLTTIRKNSLVCTKKSDLLNRDCLPIVMLLHVMVAYLMLLTASINAVCLYNAYFPKIFAFLFAQIPLFVRCPRLIDT